MSKESTKLHKLRRQSPTDTILSENNAREQPVQKSIVNTKCNLNKPCNLLSKVSPGIPSTKHDTISPFWKLSMIIKTKGSWNGKVQSLWIAFCVLLLPNECNNYDLLCHVHRHEQYSPLQHQHWTAVKHYSYLQFITVYSFSIYSMMYLNSCGMYISLYSIVSWP